MKKTVGKQTSTQPLCSECKVQSFEESGSQLRQKPLDLPLQHSQSPDGALLILTPQQRLTRLHIATTPRPLHWRTTTGRASDALCAAPNLASPSHASEAGVVKPRVSFSVGFAIARSVCHRSLCSQGRQRRSSRVQFGSNVTALEMLHSLLNIKGP